jgi:transcriptional regulator GlxA family with amidase domain
LKSAAVYQSSHNKEDYVNKRMLLATGVASLILLVASAYALSARGWQAAPQGKAPHRFVPPGPDEKVRVAFVLTEGATMIDFAGPWEVFQDTMPIRTSDKMTMPFELFTVSGSKNPIHISGGMTVVPDYTFDDAPPARIVVVPAQRGDPKLADWLRRRDKDSDVVMSVCTGAFQLGKAGLLDGKQATTHHEFYDKFQAAFPNATLVKGQRFVQSDDVIYTAGGLTSGIDLALHIVEKYYGREVAEQTAKYMEYESRRWIQ